MSSVSNATENNFGSIEHPLNKVHQIKQQVLKSFKQPEVTSDTWMLPVLPPTMKTSKNGEFSTAEMQMAFRFSYQYIILK